MNAKELLNIKLSEMNANACLDDVLDGKLSDFSAIDISSINIEILQASITGTVFDKDENALIGIYLQDNVHPLEYFCLLQACIRTNIKSKFIDHFLKNNIGMSKYIVETLAYVRSHPEEFKKEIQKAIAENKSFRIISDMIKQLECAERFYGMWNLNPYMLLIAPPATAGETEEEGDIIRED
jgi:hypothetical protein